jgi:murein DD-endopeptidase MepM/ murein hydrolase activator NlpD
VEPVEDPGAEENEPESQLQKNTRIIQVNRCHKEELVGMLWLSIPEPDLIEDPLLEGVCAESATAWCDPDFEDIYLSYLEHEKKLKLEASIFPNFVSPIDNGIVLRGMRLPTKKRRRGHYGLDIIPASLEGRGTPIKAVEDGVVIKKSRARGYGYYVVLYHQNGLFSLYSHLLKNKQVKVGQKVQRGETIGRMGKSGNARGYHLHFELIDLRETWDIEESIDVFIEALCCGCVKKGELNQFSKLLFNKQSRRDPLSSIPGLVMAKKVKGKWVPVGQVKAQAQAKK